MNKLRKYGIILTTIMGIFSSTLMVTKAAGTQASINTLYKTNTLGNAYEYVVISVEFADYTSGTIVIEVGNLGFYEYIVFGARLSNTYSSGNTRRLTLQVDDCKQAIVYCLPHAGSMVTISPSIYSNNTSYVEHVDQNAIETMFNTTNGYIDNLETQLDQLNSSIQDVVNNTTNLNTNLGLMLNAIQNNLNVDLGGIETILQNMQTVNESIKDVYSIQAYYNLIPHSTMSNTTYGLGLTLNSTLLENVTWLLEDEVMYFAFFGNGWTEPLQRVYKNEDCTVERMSTPFKLSGENGFTLYSYKITANESSPINFQFTQAVTAGPIYPVFMGKVTDTTPDEIRYLLGITENVSTQTRDLVNQLLTAQNSSNGQLSTIISLLADLSVSGSSGEAMFTARPWQVPAYMSFYRFGYLINAPYGWGVQFTDSDCICEEFAWLSANSTYYLSYMSNGYVNGLESVYYSNHNATVTRMTTPIPLNGTNGFGLFTYKIETTDGGNFTFKFHSILQNKTIYPIYLGKADSTLPEDLAFYLGIQKESAYTSQLDTISTWLETIANSINDINVQETTQNITDYNTYKQQIKDVENDFIVDFGTHDNDLDLTTLDLPEDFQINVVGFKNAFTEFFNFDIVKYVTLLTLLAGLILILLG